MSDGKGPDWYEESERDKMNMLQSCYNGNAEEVAMYLNGRVCVNEADEDGVTALQIACAKGYRNLVEFLLKHGADINLANNCGMTPFLHACREGQIEVVKLLWNNRADVFRTTGLGVSALTLACAGQHFEVIRMLLYFQLPVNPRQALIAPTPFMAACFTRDISIIGFLCQNNANKEYKLDGLSITAESFVIRCKMEYVLKGITDTKDGRIKQKTIQNSAALKNEGPLADGLTRLMYAAVMQKHADAEQILGQKKREIDAQESVIGMTALMFAIISGDDAMIQLLLNANARVNLTLTTKLQFGAVNLLQHYSNFKQETLLTAYKRYLNLRLVSEFEERALVRRTPLFYLPTAISSTDISPSSPIGMLWRVFGLSEQKSVNSRRDAEHFIDLLSTSHIDWSAPLPFVLAEEILRGDKKPARISASEPDNYVILARNIALHYLNHGDLLKPFPVGFPIDGKDDRFRANHLSHFPPIVIGSADDFNSTQFLCAAQRVDYANRGKLGIKSSVSSCPGYLETQHHLTPTASPLPKHRSMEWTDPMFNCKPQRSTNGQEKMRNAPSRPNSETQLTISSNHHFGYNDILNQQQQLQMHHQKYPSATQSLGTELFETTSLNNITSHPGSQASTPGGSGNGTPLLSRSEMPFSAQLQMPDMISRLSHNLNVSKSTNSSPNANSTVNPSESFRTTKYTKRQSATNSPRINRPKQKLDIRRLIRQALENINLESYYEIFNREEIDESQFLSLRSNEVFDILKRHLKNSKNVEEIAAKISNAISQLNNMMKQKAFA